jgi:NADH-quinone oxidoreductase E subunit
MMTDTHLGTASSNSLDDILVRWSPVGRSGLLPTLIEAQERLGWLSEQTLTQIATGLGIPLAEVYGVADFYAHLYTHPVGKKIVRVCDDVPCYLAGSEKICQSIEKHLAIRAGETTQDGEYTFEIVPCLGHCDHAPVIMLNNQVHENVNEAQMSSLLKLGDRRPPTADSGLQSAVK